MATVSPNHPIHPSFDERISVRVEGQLPDFVKQDHATFVAFLEAYYEYMELTGKPYEIVGNLRNYFNVDKTVDDFLQYFKTQFGKDVPEAVFINANKPQVLKKLRDFYRSKGSEKSFQFLFRLLYKEEIEFYYPSVDMLRVSDGKYNKDKILRTIDTSTTGTAFDLVGQIITGGTSGSTGIVELVLKEQLGLFEVITIYLSKVIGTFERAEEITDGTNTYILDGMITDYTITNAGSNYIVESNVPIVGGGTSATGAQLLIDTLTTGSITGYTVVSGGTGYVVGDKLTINNTDKLEIDGRTCSILVKDVDGSGTIKTVDGIEIEHGGYGYLATPTVSGGGTGNGANITLVGTNIGGIKALKITNNGFHYSETPTFNLTGLGDGNAVVTATIGGYEDDHATRWIGDDGFVSAANYIQDSLYYQAFSYVIKSGNTIDKWRAYVKRLVHPAGLALFGRTLITNLLSTRLGMVPGESTHPDGTPILRPPHVHYWPWTIIWHDGDIEPPVRLNLQLQGNETASPFEEWPSGGAWPHNGYQNGNGGHSDWHIYELDLPIILLAVSEKDDYEHIAHGVGVSEDYLAITASATLFDDWGYITSGIGGALQLGPLRRTLEQQKFNKEGGFSKSSPVYKKNGSGYTQAGPLTITVGVPDDANGVQAEATATIGVSETLAGFIPNTITGITITVAGSGYTKPPTLTIPLPAEAVGVRAQAIAVTKGESGMTAAGNPTETSITSGYMMESTHEGHKGYGTVTNNPIAGVNFVDATGTLRDLGGGYPISLFKDIVIGTYILNPEEKTRIMMNSHITIV